MTNLIPSCYDMSVCFSSASSTGSLGHNSRQYKTKGQSHENYKNKKQLAEDTSHQVAYHVILALAMPQQADETISLDSHPSPLSNLAVAKQKETDDDQFYQTTLGPLKIAHCVILAIVMP